METKADFHYFPGAILAVVIDLFLVIFTLCHLPLLWRVLERFLESLL